MEEFKGTDRIWVERCLGTGSFGVVYRAYDRQRKTPVALKTLRRSDPSALYRFKQEFRSLADLTHPNLVALYELMTEGEQWFFTMELLDGVNFYQYAREDVRAQNEAARKDPAIDSVTPTRTHAGDEPILGGGPAAYPCLASLPPDIDRLRDATVQLAEGVCALHDAGKLHRDLKPSNVIVTSEGRVVLLDFGLVTELAPEDHGTGSGPDIVGTPAYMSPEQAGGGKVTEATDWYSVGIMLYEALTGVLPFAGEPLDILIGKRMFEAPSPRNRLPGVPEDLNDLCRDLVRRDPQARPTGREVLRRLGGARARIWTPAAPSASTIRTTAFVGRQPQLESLHEAFRQVRGGAAVTIYIHGSSGMGKSSMVRRFLEEVRQREKNVVILTGRCYEQESVPYKGLDNLLDALSHYLKSLESHEAEALMPRDILALARLFPVLRQVKAIHRARRRVLEIPDSRELRRRAFAALRELLERLADATPLILVIDDLQWGDADSAALLAQILRPPDPPPLLLLACHRTEETERQTLRLLLPLQAASGTEAREVELRELSPADARNLADVLLEVHGVSSASLAENIAQEAAGNPFFIGELVRHAAAEREPTHTGGKIGGRASLHEVILSRVSRLPGKARQLLEVIAVAGQPLERTVATAAAGSEEEGEATLTLLRTEHLIRSLWTQDHRQVETYHDRIREAVVGSLTGDALRSHHRRLADALKTSEQADPERLAVHFQHAGELDKAARYAEAAADQASEALAFDRAARLYRLALELRPDREASRGGLQGKLGDALANVGHAAESAKAYLAAAGSEADVPALEYRRRAAEQLLRSGHIDEGLSTMGEVLASVGMALASTPRRALGSLFLHRARIGLRGLKFRERDVKEIPAEELTRIDTCWAIATGLGNVDPIRASEFQARHLILALKAGEPYRIARALAQETAYVSTRGGRSRSRTRALSRATQELVQRVAHPHARGIAALTGAVAHYMEGHWKDALQLFKESEEIFRNECTGVSWELDTAHLYALRTLFYLGELRELSARLPVLIQEANEHGDIFAKTTLMARVSYLLSLARGSPQEARQELSRGIEGWTKHGFHVEHYFEWFGHVEVDLYLGRGTAALARVRQRWPAVRRSLLLRVQIVLIQCLDLRARSALAAAVESRATAKKSERLLRSVERDARRIERERMPWGNALAARLRAAVAAARGKKEESLSLLETAETAFQRADMALHAAAVRRQRGKLLGAEAGQALIEQTDAWFQSQGVAEPARMTAMLLPFPAESVPPRP